MYYLIVLVLLFVAELFYFKIADRCNIIDKPNERSSHTRITLRGGGIIFYFGALACFLTSGWEYPCFMLALTLVTFISFVDDVKSTGQLIRLLFIFGNGVNVLSMGTLLFILVVACFGVDSLYGNYQCV